MSDISSLDSQKLTAISDNYADIFATNYVGVASITLLLYDHSLTFGDEVDYIWRRRKGPLGILFLIKNRYLTPLGFAVNMFAYLSPLFTSKVCSQFVKYEGALTTVSVALSALMMILRVNALYAGNKRVLTLLIFLFAAQIGVQAWLLSGAQAVPHPAGEYDCTLIFANNIGAWSSAYAWMPLIFDTAIVVLTVQRTISIVNLQIGRPGSIVVTLLRDGILYYCVVFSANFVLALMLSIAPDGLKGISAQLEQLITVTIVSRITLSLKKNSAPEITTERSPNTGISTMFHAGPADRWRHESIEGSETEIFELSPINERSTASIHSEIPIVTGKE